MNMGRDTNSRVPPAKEFELLRFLLNERYQASHHMRARGNRFALWILGMAVALAWILIRNPGLSLSQKILLCVLVVIVGALSAYFLFALRRGFIKNRAVMIKLERALGCYEKGAYTEDDAIYSDEYETNKASLWGHFEVLMVWVVSISLVIIVLILLSPTQKPGQMARKASSHEVGVSRVRRRHGNSQKKDGPGKSPKMSEHKRPEEANSNESQPPSQDDKIKE